LTQPAPQARPRLYGLRVDGRGPGIRGHVPLAGSARRRRPQLTLAGTRSP
jgi:hypothetical protein